MNRLLLALIAATFSASVAADAEPIGVPEKLFGIALGGIYDLGDLEKKDYGDIPVKKATGMKSFLGAGIHYYFQPKEAHKFFSYVEKRKKPGDKAYETSFRLYVLPVIPSTITTNEQLDDAKLKWEVAVIEWSGGKAKTEKDAYFWAADLCKTFAADIAVKPAILDDYETNVYNCTFASGDRKFEVDSMLRTVTLEYSGELFKKKSEAVENTLRKLQATEIRPY